jgi:hypothetical protein
VNVEEKKKRQRLGVICKLPSFPSSWVGLSLSSSSWCQSPPVFNFKAHGQSGLMISDAFPNLAEHADELCLLNGMKTSTASHSQATVALHTGSENFVRPSMGSWRPRA